MKIYYAHSMALYNTPQEAADVRLLKQLGFEVFNPNQPFVQQRVQQAKAQGVGNYMATVFNPIMDDCQAIAFRAHKDNRIGAGVWHEIKYMTGQGKPMIELPHLLPDRPLSVEATRAYIRANAV